MMKIYVAIIAMAMATSASAGSKNNNQNTNTAVAQSNTHVTDNRGVSYPVNSAFAPSFGTANGCALGASGAASGSGFSISLGGAAESKDCLAQNAANMATSFADRGWVSPAVPVNTACENTAFRDGMYYAGTPCANDSRRAKAEYRSCENRDGKMYVQIAHKGNQQRAVAQCKAALGIR